MGSPTQQVLDLASVRRIVAASLGAGVHVASAQALAGGGFAAVWRADLADGRTVVVKVGPGDGVALLGYERDLIAAEAACFDLVGTRAPGVPVPRVLFCGSDRAVVDGEITAPRFGYGHPARAGTAGRRPSPRSSSPCWTTPHAGRSRCPAGLTGCARW